MKPHPKVTIILTSYNHAKYLRDAVDSVLDQTFSDFELIIWDDASTDESWNIIQGYNDSRIHTFRNETNMRGNINRALLSGKVLGNYVAIHHSDDFWEPQKLEKQVAFLDSNPRIGAVFSNALIIGENGEPFDDVSHFYYKIFEQPNRTRQEWLNYFFYYGNALCHPSVLIRKSCYDDCGLYRYGFAQLPDLDMWVRLCLKYDIHILAERLVQFRVRLNGESASSDRPEARIRAPFELLQILYSYLEIANPEDFVKIFPDSTEYFKHEQYDLAFALAMTTLKSEYNFFKYFGLRQLWEILNDENKAKKVQKIYGFSNLDFIELTARHDVFSATILPALIKQLAEQDMNAQSLISHMQALQIQFVKKEQTIDSIILQKEKNIQDLQMQVDEKAEQNIKINGQLTEIRTKLDSIVRSNSWKLFMVFHGIVERIFPPQKWRGYSLSKLINSLRGLTIKDDLRLLRSSDLFDRATYIANNPDVNQAGIDPARHYLLFGAFEGRDPGPNFSSRWYLDTYVDVRISSVNPLVHYLRYGQAEGRLVKDPEDIQVNDQKEARTTTIIQVNSETPILTNLYGKVYKKTGLWLRSHFSNDWVDSIRRFAPNPYGIPKHLTYQLESANHANISLAEFIPPDAHAKPDIFVFSIIDWDFRHQRPQHVAEGLAKNGRRVFYIEQALSSRGLILKEILDNLYKVRLSSLNTGHIQPYNGEPTPETIRNWINALYELCDVVHATSFKQIIIQHPFWWQLARHLSPEFQIIYDCMDDIAEFSNTEPFIVELEHDLLRKCDKLVVSSQHLFDKYIHLNAPVLIRNAADIEHFADSRFTTTDRKTDFDIHIFSQKKDTPNIKVGYVGAISDWFDVDLIKSAAQLDPDIEYHLCGAVTSREAVQLKTLSNVIMYGEIKYADAPEFLNQMDVAIIPFQIIPIIEACDPVKFYEYSAIGIPTVTTPLPELARASDLTLTASTPSEFVRQIKKAYAFSQNNNFREKLIQYASENTWRHRIAQFTDVLENLPSVTVVILSYGDTKFTKETIGSLYHNGTMYPNLEVLVVDNGSPKKALDEIRGFSSDFHGVRIIENGENLGFARGNNVGMKFAGGDYIMLLNNDTMVSPGAIYALVRHLERNPQVGVVGPLTNNIGNEAKVFVEYEGLKEMIQIARRLTTGYRDMHTELNVLAYFAVMFRHEDMEIFGYLSEEYGQGMFEDDDHCATIKLNGYKCILAEDSYIHHHLSASFSSYEGKKALFERNKAIFESKWGEWKPHQYRKQRPESSLDSKITKNSDNFGETV
jgi:GT2 family glycosyltransferase